jgi:hypothetical protein
MGKRSSGRKKRIEEHLRREARLLESGLPIPERPIAGDFYNRPIGKRSGKKSRRDANFLKSRLPISKYPSAWKEYNRRWYTVWLGLLALAVYFIIICINFPRAHKTEAKFLLLLGIVVFMTPYYWFNSWPCPRCGVAFSDYKRKVPVRPERCHFCGLRRNTVPGEPKTPKLQDQDMGQ